MQASRISASLVSASLVSAPETIADEITAPRIMSSGLLAPEANLHAADPAMPATARATGNTQPLHPAFRPLAIPALVAATQIMRGGAVRRIG